MIENKWSLIIIDDAPNFLQGKSLCEILKLLSTTAKFNFVVWNHIDGSGADWLISALQIQSNKIMKIDEFLKIISDIKQIDWGDFFLFKDYPNFWRNPKGELYPYVIAQPETTVRAVDNQYFYIYTRYQEVVNVIQNHYKIESIKIGSLEELDYPE